MRKLKITNFIMLTIAGIVNAFGITVFLMPVKLYDSGISGTSMLFDQLTPEYLTLSIFLVILNIPLFLRYFLIREYLKEYVCHQVFSNVLFALKHTEQCHLVQ